MRAEYRRPTRRGLGLYPSARPAGLCSKPTSMGLDYAAEQISASTAAKSTRAQFSHRLTLPKQTLAIVIHRIYFRLTLWYCKEGPRQAAIRVMHLRLPTLPVVVRTPIRTNNLGKRISRSFMSRRTKKRVVVFQAETKEWIRLREGAATRNDLSTAM
jgi:hypothetical protein